MKWRCVVGEGNRARVVSRLKRFEAEKREVGSQQPRAAVLLPIVVEADTPAVMFTVRSSTLSHHRGQISFPGGAVDDGDASLVAAALRESQEELGLEPTSVDVWGTLPCIPDRRERLLITPVVGYVASCRMAELCYNPSEVQSVFALPLSHLASPKNRRYTEMRGARGMRMPVFLGGPRRIWGITAFILDMALLHLLPPSFDYHSVLYN